MKAKEVYGKIEFWIVTIIAASFLLALLIESKGAENNGSYWFEQYQLEYNFFKHLFLPAMALIFIYYSAFIFLTKFVDEKKTTGLKLVVFLVRILL
ncbi:hypothetical protein [Niabella ginsengisoli]|uniref:Uncharacterized protein n=1 Tax=Niabella ginsengisoli TaxID=522298 RepID=A0ABS9SP16_9BACT|nr:hypothetical protein [Niabella ginsengisoli]MCH5600102.1 hypothetical protein [Niabella ginsengisoli]